MLIQIKIENNDACFNTDAIAYMFQEDNGTTTIHFTNGKCITVDNTMGELFQLFEENGIPSIKPQMIGVDISLSNLR